MNANTHTQSLPNLVFKNLDKKSDRNNWKNYYYEISNSFITDRLISFALNSFWKNIIIKYKITGFHIFMKVSFSDGSTRSISRMQTSSNSNEDKDTLKDIEELINSKQELLNTKENFNPNHDSDTENPFINNQTTVGGSEKDNEEELNTNKASDGVIKETDTTTRQSSYIRKGIKNNGLIDIRKLFNERFTKRYYHSTPSSNAESKNEWNGGDINTLKTDQVKLDLFKNKIPLRLSEYLLSIRNILNNTKLNDDKSLFNTQSKIENMWLDILKENLQNYNYSNIVRSKSKNILKEITKFILKYNNSGNLKKKFPEFYNELLDERFVYLAFSLLLGHYHRLGTTMLASTISNHIVRIMYNDFIKKYKTEKITFDLFKKQIKMDTNENQIKLGMFYVSLFTGESMEIFKKEYSPDTVTYLNINTNYSDEIIDNMIIHPNTLPMITKPLNWSDKNYGGYIQNQNLKQSIVTGSQQHSHKIENKSKLYKAEVVAQYSFWSVEQYECENLSTFPKKSVIWIIRTFSG